MFGISFNVYVFVCSIVIAPYMSGYFKYFVVAVCKKKDLIAARGVPAGTIHTYVRIFTPKNCATEFYALVN